MSGGIYLDELKKTTKKCEVDKLSKHSFRIVLTQGLNRQIRRMCDYLNYDVLTLKRTRIMNIVIDTPVGEYRELTQDEFKELSALLENSQKDYEAKSTKK